MERDSVLKQLMSYHFAAYDLLLYLDTHPCDKKAFDMFKDVVKKYRAAKTEYEQKYGPVCAFDAADFDSFNWIDSPWPWEKEAN